MDSLFKNISKESLLHLSLICIGFVVLYWILLFILRKLGKDPSSFLPEGVMKRIGLPLFLFFVATVVRMESFISLFGMEDDGFWFKKASTLTFILAFTLLVIGILKIIKRVLLHRYDVNEADNLKARKIYTQFNILERIVIFIVIILAIGLALMSFKEIREIGISIFASAGVAGIIIGFSAQKLIGTILAGVQIAIAQPIKIDDVVIVESEWGRIEEITLTYVVVKIWDKRRLIVPTPYFIEKPFQNWTKTSADLLGTVYLYTDYKVPFNALREELTSILKGTDLWDGEVNNIQVTDSKADYVEVRALMSAKDASTAWDLRVMVREKLISFLQENYPESIAQTRVLFKNMTEKDA
ncbi:mechanosensitive ion channel family protein [Maribacter sp. 2210JD10-5]|uniref:mechanosensitive ion channel family protein n=1 Tax=Maribacter sp. 2210JD10-5 TaxID=3386272 RepID=UPI0039BD1816